MVRTKAITDPQTIATIRKLAARGKTRRMLAKQFGVCAETIGKIVRREGVYDDGKARTKPPAPKIRGYDMRGGLKECPQCGKPRYLPSGGGPCVECQVRATM
jgi:hypothetical protein